MSRLRDRAAIAIRGLEARVGALSGRTQRQLAWRRGVAVLMYHRVLPDDAPADGIEPGMFVRASTFRVQMEWLAARWRVVPLGDARPEVAAEVAAVVTFDDGWRDNLTVAWPIMRALGIRPTIFLVRDWVRQGAPPQASSCARRRSRSWLPPASSSAPTPRATPTWTGSPRALRPRRCASPGRRSRAGRDGRAGSSRTLMATTTRRSSRRRAASSTAA